MPRLFRDHGQIAQEGRVGLRQLAIDLHRFFCGGQRLLAAAQFAVADAQVVQGTRQIAQEGRVGLRQLAIDLHRFFRGGQRLLAAAQFAVAVAQVVQGMARSPRKAGLVFASSR